MKLSHFLAATLLSSGIAVAQTGPQVKKESRSEAVAIKGKAKPKAEKKQKVICSEKVLIDPTALQKPFSCPACGRG